jgi:hypothetical protein
MEMQIGFVSVNEQVDGFSAVKLGSVTETLQAALSEEELNTYSSAIYKVAMGEKLDRGDVILFNKIDEITMRKHGMCLKDAAITKARIGACKRNGIKFIDHDNLIDHMKFMMG